MNKAQHFSYGGMNVRGEQSAQNPWVGMAPHGLANAIDFQFKLINGFAYMSSKQLLQKPNEARRALNLAIDLGK